MWDEVSNKHARKMIFLMYPHPERKEEDDTRLDYLILLRNFFTYTLKSYLSTAFEVFLIMKFHRRRKRIDENVILVSERQFVSRLIR